MTPEQKTWETGIDFVTPDKKLNQRGLAETAVMQRAPSLSPHMRRLAMSGRVVSDFRCDCSDVSTDIPLSNAYPSDGEDWDAVPDPDDMSRRCYIDAALISEDDSPTVPSVGTGENNNLAAVPATSLFEYLRVKRRRRKPDM